MNPGGWVVDHDAADGHSPIPSTRAKGGHFGRAQARTGIHAVDEWEALTPAEQDEVAAQARRARAPHIEEWCAATADVYVPANDDDFLVSSTDHMGRVIWEYASVIRAKYEALNTIEPARCAICGRYADTSRDDERCVEHALSWRVS